MDHTTLILFTGSAVSVGCSLALWHLARKAPAGYEDADGFHYGDQPACPLPPAGWACTREPGHEGPCAAVGPWEQLPEPANVNLPVLTENQARVLREMDADLGHTANTLMQRTGFSHILVNKARRDLRDMGLAFHGPLFDQDTGRPSGSGYLLTAEGERVKAALVGVAVAA
jgi:hypothetical protein